MLLTHAPYAIGVQAMLESATGATVALCALHELSSERDLKKEVDSFFEAAAASASSADTKLFVLQCDPSTTSLRRIQHARYILDNARAQHASNGSGSASGASVCFVILMHLARDDAAFAFDFDRRWRYAYVDTVDASTGADFPPLSFLMRASMPEIIGKLRYKTLHLIEPITAIVYPNKKNNLRLRNIFKARLSSQALLFDRIILSHLITCLIIPDNLV